MVISLTVLTTVCNFLRHLSVYVPTIWLPSLGCKCWEDGDYLIHHYALVPGTEPGAQALSKDMLITGTYARH